MHRFYEINTSVAVDIKEGRNAIDRIWTTGERLQIVNVINGATLSTRNGDRGVERLWKVGGRGGTGSLMRFLEGGTQTGSEWV